MGIFMFFYCMQLYDRIVGSMGHAIPMHEIGVLVRSTYSYDCQFLSKEPSYSTKYILSVLRIL